MRPAALRGRDGAGIGEYLLFNVLMPALLGLPMIGVSAGIGKVRVPVVIVFFEILLLLLLADGARRRLLFLQQRMPAAHGQIGAKVLDAVDAVSAGSWCGDALPITADGVVVDNLVIGKLWATATSCSVRSRVPALGT